MDLKLTSTDHGRYNQVQTFTKLYLKSVNTQRYVV